MMKLTRKLLSPLLAVVLMVILVPFSMAQTYVVTGANTVSIPVAGYEVGAYHNNCWKFAQTIYQKIWGVGFDSYRGTSDDMLRAIGTGSARAITAANTKRFISAAPLGSVIRISTIIDGNDNQPTDYQHSQILIQKDSNGFTVYEGNVPRSKDDQTPVIRIKYFTWSDYANGWANWQYFKYIKYPNATAFEVGPHTCDKGTPAGAGGTHPHNSYYYCSICGANWRDWDSSNYVESCETCNTMVNLGDEFFGVILNTKHWIPIANTYGAVDLRKENGTAEQVWFFDRQDDGTYIISSASDGKVLEIENGSTELNTQLIAKNEYMGKNFQRWRIYKQGDGYVLISAHGNSAVTLENGSIEFGTKVTAFTRNDTDSQIWSIYKGQDVQLQAPVLTVDVGTSKRDTTFNWTETYGETHFDFKIWRDVLWQGEAFHIEYDADIGFGITLPAGTYHAYVDACNHYKYIKSNTVTFTVTEQTDNPVFSVVYDANGGTGAPPSQSREYGSCMELSQNIPKRIGYLFTGWNTKADGSGLKYYSGDAYFENDDLVLYAQWELIDYLIQKDGSGLNISSNLPYIWGDELLGINVETLRAHFENDNVVIKPVFANNVGTGTKVQLVENDVVIEEKEVIIFGDINGDGQFDGQDAVYVNCLLEGMMTPEDIEDSAYEASDATLDGELNELDAELLTSAGLKQATVRQQ